MVQSLDLKHPLHNKQLHVINKTVMLAVALVPGASTVNITGTCIIIV